MIIQNTVGKFKKVNRLTTSGKPAAPMRILPDADEITMNTLTRLQKGREAKEDKPK